MTIDPTTGYPYTPEKYAEFAGNQAQQAFQYFRDIDTAMRDNYSKNIYQIGQNIYPLLYVESTFDGGRYTLVLNENKRFVHQSVGDIYDMAKAVAHIPLGIFSIISGYGLYPRNGQWLSDLKIYRDRIQRVKENISYIEPSLTGFVKSSILSLVDRSINYINSIISNSIFSYKDYQEYARAQDGDIAILQQRAASNQVEVMTSVLKSWKETIGDELWDEMYVVIGAVWTLTAENAHELIISSMMNPDLRETHIVVSEAVPDLESAQTLLGRIVGDRVMAEMVFDASAAVDYAEDIYSLSTRRDLLSQAVERELESKETGRSTATKAIEGCPHLQKAM
ncbi:hypothetical protein JAU75_16020 [Ochrobactrum sp. Q0168]|uniref:hypothetical protein n=1 Tax=Ochrobactrum sp. Q0168 TaxID=2793241 RepID=UPI0018EC62EA|nr:hypothetical protein [Ochrobactrum sp. Q0168]